MLEKALALERKSKEIAARLGDAYALAILGITKIDKNGLPTGGRSGIYDGDVARRARQALNQSNNPYRAGESGLSDRVPGRRATALHKIEFDQQPLAEATVARAVSLAPKDTDVAAYQEEVGELKKLKMAANDHK